MKQSQRREAAIQDERELFSQARQFLKPGPVFRLAVSFYAERKYLVFALMLLVSTLVCWLHFGLIKWQELDRSIPEDSPNYWWKRIVPPIVFGWKHALLFQMAVIPLTMSRYSIAAISESILNRYIPMNQMMRLHLLLGYSIVYSVSLVLLVFFVLYGHLCRAGEEAYCDAFTIEIMVTGYLITVLFWVVGGTSYFRHSIPYKVFYAMHHLVFIVYAAVILHTFDSVHRDNERNRSQAYKWVWTTLLFYVCDRAVMHMNSKYRARLVASSTLEGSNGSRTILLKLRRPYLFEFKPGQYAFLRLEEIDHWWHPFSIASDPGAQYLEFYIEVFGDWTARLWQLLESDKRSQSANDVRCLEITFDVMGPCGTSLMATPGDFSHVLAVGTGTGIVPTLSLFKQHVHCLLKLNPESHYRNMQEHNDLVQILDTAAMRRKGTMAEKLIGALCTGGSQENRRLPGGASSQVESSRNSLSESMRDAITRHGQLQNSAPHDNSVNKRKMKAAAWNATRSIYAVAPLSLLSILGLLVISLSISWNTTPIDTSMYDWMAPLVQSLSYIFQICFFVVSCFIWDEAGFFACTDVVACLISPFADASWHKQYDEHGSLRPSDVALFCLLHAYMGGRTWGKVVQPHRSPWHSSQGDSATTVDRLQLVWTTRSAFLASKVLPDINEVWDDLLELWGKEAANEACRISIYVTDTDRNQIAALKEEARGTSLYENGCMVFGSRPDFEKIVQDYTLELTCTRRNSYSLLAFCGSPTLAAELHRIKIENDMMTSITGNKAHQMEYVSESYGGAQNKKKEFTSDHEPTASSSTLDGVARNLGDEGESGSHVNTPIRVNTIFSGTEVDA